MNPFVLSAAERLDDWKAFRKSLATMDPYAQLEATAAYWAQAPLVPLAYDPEHPETWGTPWEMVSEGRWCRLSAAIGMEFTLRLAGWSEDRLTLTYLNDRDLKDMFFVLEIDDEYLLNYTFKSVARSLSDNKIIIASWRFKDKVYHPLRR